MSEHYRRRRISETILRYRPAELPGGKHGVRDVETGRLVADASYDDDTLARVKCRMLAAADHRCRARQRSRLVPQGDVRRPLYRLLLSRTAGRRLPRPQPGAEHCRSPRRRGNPVLTAVDPEPRRCGVCGTRLSRVEPGHEDACYRRSFGWSTADGDGAEPATGATLPATVAAMEARDGR